MSNGATPHKHINTMSMEKILYINKVDLGDLRRITQTDIISVDYSVNFTATMKCIWLVFDLFDGSYFPLL